MRLAKTLLVALFLTVARPATASTRLAVFIVADDASLSNDLTEVAIARLAEKPGYELVGLRELESRLNELETVKSDGLRACLTSAACRSEVGVIAGVEREVVGDLRREGDQYRLDLELVDAKTGETEQRISRQSSPELDQLIIAVQTGVFELVPEQVDRVAPAATVPTASPPAAPRRSDENLRTETKSTGTAIIPYVAYGSAALAVIAFSAAAVTGTIGTAKPTGSSRAEIQDDVERRQRYATAANGLLVAGGVLAGVAVVSFAVSWD